MKITDNRKADETGIFKGGNVLDVTAGNLVIVLKHPDGTNEGEILLRTDSNEQPFVTLEDGQLWGNSLTKYTFQILNNYNFILE